MKKIFFLLLAIFNTASAQDIVVNGKILRKHTMSLVIECPPIAVMTGSCEERISMSVDKNMTDTIEAIFPLKRSLGCDIRLDYKSTIRCVYVQVKVWSMNKEILSSKIYKITRKKARLIEGAFLFKS